MVAKNQVPFFLKNVRFSHPQYNIAPCQSSICGVNESSKERGCFQGVWK